MLVMNQKALCLFRYIQKYKYIVANDDFSDLIQRALDIMTTLRLDEDTLTEIGVTQEDVGSLNLPTDTALNWIEIIV